MLFNGEKVEGAWTGTRALHYGDGVFRTGLVLAGGLVDRERQLAKLAADAARLELEVSDALHQEIDRACDGIAQGVLRIVLSRTDSGRGYRPAGTACDRILNLAPMPDQPKDLWIEGIDVGWSRVLLGIQPRLAGIKHLNRLEQVIASRECPADRHEVVMCDAAGRVTCGTRTNLFFVIDGILVTPDVSLAGVAGMMRDKIVELARHAEIGCEIGLISPDEVRHASECFATNSLAGIWPIRRLGSLEFKTPGPVTGVLRDRLQHPWSGR